MKKKKKNPTPAPAKQPEPTFDDILETACVLLDELTDIIAQAADVEGYNELARIDAITDLNDELWEFSLDNGWLERDEDEPVYIVSVDYEYGEPRYKISKVADEVLFCPAFVSPEVAEAAIEEVITDFVLDVEEEYDIDLF